MPDATSDARLHRYARATSGTRGSSRIPRDGLPPVEPPPRHNLAIDAELDSLRAERARLIQQCEAAGVDTTPNTTTPTAVRALHPRAVVLPTLLAVCASCGQLERALRDAQSARFRIEHKYTIMQTRRNELDKTNRAYRSTINRLQANLVAAHERMARAGVPILGPVYIPTKPVSDTEATS